MMSRQRVCGALALSTATATSLFLFCDLKIISPPFTITASAVMSHDNTHDPFTDRSVPKRIQKIQFGALNPRDIAQLSVVEVSHHELYKRPQRIPRKFGPMDPLLGVPDKTSLCGSCGRDINKCPGHFGHIQLILPVFHIGFIKHIASILNCVCKQCSKLLLSADDKAKILTAQRSSKCDQNMRIMLLKRVVEICKKTQMCPSCGESNFLVKKVRGQLRLVHDRNVKSKAASANFVSLCADAVKETPEMESMVDKLAEEMDPLRSLTLFRNISNEDCELLDMNPNFCRPEDLIITNLLVPPICIRPSVVTQGSSGSNEDDLTVKLGEIVLTNNTIRIAMEKGSGVLHILEDWMMLQAHVTTYFNADNMAAQQIIAGNRNQKPKPMRSFYQRLKGKQGRFRGNLSGKRVDHSGRTVISPDPNLRVDEVAIPVLIAMDLTYPERVTLYNMPRLKKMVANGPTQWPGANHCIITAPNGARLKQDLRWRKEEIADNLKTGDVVLRHLIDGDAVLFNRQPSLHRISIMCHRARILPWRTFRFNECCCAPYNADFDGDEMNIHIPQTEEARVEALELMGVKNNLITPRHGEMLIAATQDFLSASFILTRKNMFLDRSQMTYFASFFSDAKEYIDLPPPAIIKPARLWTGKQLYSLLFKPNRHTKIRIFCEMIEENYVKIGGATTDAFCTAKGIATENQRKQIGANVMCSNDGYVVFHDSDLLCGQIGKNAIGKEAKSSLFYILTRDNKPEDAVDCMTRLSKFCARWLTLQGFSFGIGDVWPSEPLNDQKKELMRISYETCSNYIERFEAGDMTLLDSSSSSSSLEEALEFKLTKVLNEVRSKASAILTEGLHWNNTALNMYSCKSKGSKENIAQMTACVGQQAMGSSRIPDGFLGRSLPHFHVGSKYPDAKGFVKNSFFSGLTATEFFFHTMTGRVGLVDTAVKTAETGYMQRRLMKGLEDLTIAYDGSVRSSAGSIVQFRFGEDGLDPMEMESSVLGRPVDYARLLHIAQMSMISAGETPLSQAAICERVNAFITDNADNFSSKFCEETQVALKDVFNTDDITMTQLNFVLETAQTKYAKSICDPGTAVGAICGQSIGEPGTQMTLKTFHFAGLASMALVLGVPRIKEIINAAKTIATPFISAPLVNQSSEHAARIVKRRLEKTTLGQIANYIKEVYCESQVYLSIKIDLDLIMRLGLIINTKSIRDSILSTPRTKLKEPNVILVNPYRLHITVPGTMKGKLLQNLQQLRKQLPRVLVSGTETVNRVIISSEKAAAGNIYKLYVEGRGLREVMSTSGVRGTGVTSNDIMEICSTLGIEAARNRIIYEFQYTMGDSFGLKIDPRHMMLLADLMCFKGEVLGITRFGIAKLKESVLMLASFEKTVDILFDGAAHSRCDDVCGVSESIITGTPIPLGTGMFRLLQSESKESAARPSPGWGLQNNEYFRRSKPMLRMRDNSMSSGEYHVNVSGLLD